VSGSAPARLLTIMGSGESAPTMAKVHRGLLERLGPPPVPAALLDTPFGFQENADHIVVRARAYFAESVGTDITLATLRSASDADAVELAAFVAAVQAARYVFAGPGSPSYALRQWRGGPLKDLLAEKLRHGGAVTFSSAAALTLGVATVPVYEIYKAGDPPGWLEGLNVLAEAGLSAAVIPHYNNAEGGNHDTRYCYLGERRLSAMEPELPAGAFVLGVDEHTALVLDLGERTASVLGLGVVTVRAGGRSARLAAGTTVPLDELTARAAALGAGGPDPSPAAAGGGEAPGAPAGACSGTGGPARSPLLEGMRRQEAAFSAALAAGRTEEAVRAILSLDEELVAWSRDTLESAEADRVRAAVHAMVLSLGRLAEVGARDPRQIVGPFVEALLDQRARARADRRYAEADAIRDRLVALGVELRDTPAGTEWLLAPGAGAGGSGVAGEPRE
jgi:cyanophycinase-like exopeptidase